MCTCICSRRLHSCSMELLGLVTFCNKVYLNSQAPVSEKYLIQYFHTSYPTFAKHSYTVTSDTAHVCITSRCKHVRLNWEPISYLINCMLIELKV